MSEINIQPLQSPFLKLAKDEQFFSLHRAALEWDIEEPIIIEKPDDVKSKATWHDLLNPFHHQVTNLITFCRRLPVTLLADDVGLGKTISAGLVLSELISRNRVSKTLIVCPKILMPQWKEELISKFRIEADYGSGVSAIRHGISKLKKQDQGVFITTYASARDHLHRFEEAGFQMLILDEAHKLRNLYGTQAPPKTAIRMRKALADRNFRYVLMLTATPIQNRLWDLYSLIDLLTVARGHQNPFGSEERFARRYIADSSDKARKLNPKYKEEFRSIVYGYMSRVRRADAKLSFPERKVKLHHVKPTSDELELIKVVGREIASLNKLAQISLLKALVSSPQALLSQLRHMAAKGTIKSDTLVKIQEVANKITITSKLHGLEVLVDRLRKERPGDWRMVVFTQLLETQKAIAEHLEAKGITFGTINGESARRNQETIRRFSTKTPEINVVVSTEAGAEGVNLQVANVLVNYDLPWNPMIVEQRIGRIQRLGSTHANVTVFNAILEGTFEEYIVGRLMEKLQLATTAIGDIDSLLEAAGLEDDDGDVTGFEEMIRQLVIASLAGKNVDEDTRLKTESIEQARIEIAREEKNIEEYLGGMNDSLKRGPRAPKMSPPNHLMSIKDFSLAALRALGKAFHEERPGIFVSDDNSERIAFDNDLSRNGTIAPLIYAPGRPLFDRLTAQFTSEHECAVDGLVFVRRNDFNDICASWSTSFGGAYASVSENGIASKFTGKALVRARISVAHDSFEKIMEIAWESRTPIAKAVGINNSRLDPTSLDIPTGFIIEAIIADPDVREFSRFYLERRAEEMQSAGNDEHKKVKLRDEFTPKLDPSLVGLTGKLSHSVALTVRYQLNGQGDYASTLQVSNETGQIIFSPKLEHCELSNINIPTDCIEICAVTNKRAARHLLAKSEASGCFVLPQHIVICAISGKRVAVTETISSSITGKPCLKSLSKVSAISKKMGEPDFFNQCDFTETDVLLTELLVSQVSQRKYRADQEEFSVISGIKGHRSEFVRCSETSKSLLLNEAEHCEVSGEVVAPGVLIKCEISGKRAKPSLLGKCDVSGKRVLTSLLATSSVSKKLLLKELGIQSKNGKFCLPIEAIRCAWDGLQHHPDDIDICTWTGVAVSQENLDGNILKPLSAALQSPPGIYGASDIHTRALQVFSHSIGKGNYRIQAEIKSATGHSIALAVESRTWLGFRKRVFGFIYSVDNNQIDGKIIEGRREAGRWEPIGGL